MPNVRDQRTVAPVPMVGTVCRSVMRPTLRGGIAAGTARKLLWNVSMSPKTVADSSLASGSTAHASARRRPDRVVGFRRAVDRADLAVLAVLVEVPGADEHVQPRRGSYSRPTSRCRSRRWRWCRRGRVRLRSRRDSRRCEVAAAHRHADAAPESLRGVELARVLAAETARASSVRVCGAASRMLMTPPMA